MSARCRHERASVIRERCFAGPVGPACDENRAAHGNITVTEECAACGARRDVNVNGMHEECGSWGPTRADREREAWALVEAARCATRAVVPVVMSSGEREITLSVDRAGMLLGDGDASDVIDAYRAAPESFRAEVIAARNAVIAARNALVELPDYERVRAEDLLA